MEALIPSPNADFSSTLVYSSNRNTGLINDQRGDTIAVFTLDAADGTLRTTNQFLPGLKQVLGTQFGGPDVRFPVASGLVGGGSVVVSESGREPSSCRWSAIRTFRTLQVLYGYERDKLGPWPLLTLHSRSVRRIRNLTDLFNPSGMTNSSRSSAARTGPGFTSPTSR